MKWNLLVFIKTKVCLFLFKTRKVRKSKESFLRAFENRNGKLLRFLWSSHLRSSVRKSILKISQNSQENTCIGVSFLINLHASGLQLYQKKETPTQVFSCEFSKIFKNTFFSEHLRKTASEFHKWKESFWKRNIYSMVSLFRSFIYKSYCIVTNIRRPANKFIKPC